MPSPPILAHCLGISTLLSQQGGPGAGGCAGGGGLNFIIMMVAMFAIFYFLLIRPQQKKAKQHQEMLRALKKGDRVVTNGGLMGVVTGTAEKFLTIEIAEKVRVRVMRSHVAGKEGDAELEGARKS
jgi:preprotein translocase subunit YajC